MRLLSIIALAAITFAGCDQTTSAPVRPVATPVVPRADVEVREPRADVEVGGPQGGIHVNDPAGGTKVDIGGGNGVRVRTPDSAVDVP